MPTPDRQRPENGPFYGAVFDPNRKMAANILIEAASGIGITNQNLINRWQLCVYQINELGPEDGKQVLETLNALAQGADGLSLLITQSTISVYCKLKGIPIPQIPKSR